MNLFCDRTNGFTSLTEVIVVGGPVVTITAKTERIRSHGVFEQCSRPTGTINYFSS